MSISNSQLDRLGNRLKKGSIAEDDVRILEDYRRSFIKAYEVVIDSIRLEIMLEPTGRPAKSTTSIIDKLRREGTRLSRMQDIAGCRIVVPSIHEQDSVVEMIRDLFKSAVVVDRRLKPSHGYRAVHIIVDSCERWIEIQVRTLLQHAWAELSEKISDTKGPSIKYGGGDQESVAFLTRCSKLVENYEEAEKDLLVVKKELGPPEDLADNVRNWMEIEQSKFDVAQKILIEELTAIRDTIGPGEVDTEKA